jgi:DNA polymerase III epsilon subunit-like protein
MIMCEIKTLVYCDLEATGLKNSGRPRITELSLVAVNTESILDLNVVLLSHLQKNNINVERMFPRVLNKLTICVYPMATIRTEVSEITGLDNYNLSGQATFDKETGELLNSFLERLPKPLCLVAHNGDSYDFPLLKAELEKVKVILPYETLCADSYVGIKEIFKRSKNALQVQNKMDFICLGKPTSYSLINLHKHLLGCYPFQAHGAEVDCLALIRTTAVLGIEWVNWVKGNCQLFSMCTKMWSFQTC